MLEPTDRSDQSSNGRWAAQFWPAFALGNIALIAQTILARESMAAAAGHELMFGVMLAEENVVLARNERAALFEQSAAVIYLQRVREKMEKLKPTIR